MDIRDEFLPLAKPIIEDEEIKIVNEVLKSGWLTTGPKVQEFEQNMQEYLGCKKAVGLTSCTGGLHIALSALGIGPGDEVIVPTYTFVTCGHVVAWLGATPILVDVDKETFNIDPDKIEEAITDKTKAIMPVHFAGHSCDMDRIMEVARKNNLYVIEDAAHAIGTDYKDKKIGNFGDATVFSFYVTKTMTTAEGGMIVTNHEKLGDKFKRYSYFGVDKDAYNRYTDKGTWYYEVIELGYKYNMDNIHGALGVEQLKKLEFFITKRRKLAKLYDEMLKDVPEVTTPSEKPYTRHSYHLYPVIIDVDNIGMNRAKFIDRLREYKIGLSVHFIPLHLHPYYQKNYGYKRGDLPVAEHLFDREVSLPLYPGMTEEDVKYVVEAIREIVSDSKTNKHS
jgi:dTDP-4-amino-4,6-dideoxygalactose transaminase